MDNIASTMDLPSPSIIHKIAVQLHLNISQVNATIKLLRENYSIPFITRYRQQITQGLDDGHILDIQKAWQAMTKLEAKRVSALELLEKLRETSTTNLSTYRTAIVNAENVNDIKDVLLLLNANKSRGSLASVAREKPGIASLVDLIWNESTNSFSFSKSIHNLIRRYHHSSNDNVIEFAGHVLAEIIAYDPDIRKQSYDIFLNTAFLCTTLCKKKTKNTSSKNNSNNNPDKSREMVYADVSSVRLRCRDIKSHRLMAIERGENEHILKVSIESDDDHIVQNIISLVFSRIRHNNRNQQSKVKNDAFITKDLKLFLLGTISDSYKRLLRPYLQRHLRSYISKQAHERCICIFLKNISSMILASPVTGIAVVGIDPGFRHGLKIAVLSTVGDVIATKVISAWQPTAQSSTSSNYSINRSSYLEFIDLLRLVAPSVVVAVGNGQGCHFTIHFLHDLTIKYRDTLQKDLHMTHIKYYIVNEAGCSIYSICKSAKTEFPNIEPNLRSAIAIARRLQSPLSQILNIDDISTIGIGQYQKDIKKKTLANILKNDIYLRVYDYGVDVNNVSEHVLVLIPGVSSTIASEILLYRHHQSNNKIKKRCDLLNIKKITKSIYNNIIGFLRIYDGDETLDATDLHPETYSYVDLVFEKLNIDFRTIILSINNGIMDEKQIVNIELEISQKLKSMDAHQWISYIHQNSKLRNIDDNINEYFIRSLFNQILSFFSKNKKICKNLIKTIEYSTNEQCRSMELNVGDNVTGVIRSLTDFGLFIDVGGPRDGLLHRSELLTKTDLDDEYRVGDVLRVYISKVDPVTQRISLSLAPSMPLNLQSSLCTSRILKRDRCDSVQLQASNKRKRS